MADARCLHGVLWFRDCWQCGDLDADQVPWVGVSPCSPLVNGAGETGESLETDGWSAEDDLC